ncbi:tectonin beta-propeller repeat-containing protein 2 isoform X3 [Mastomys coucha]|uniref:tectonin beta-propeller repeat-containing protein 2 isoform X3 n=1 Tax=Mastomys coucha TaxID=35658 RepID=UPI001261FFAE|nr:tectonin beta-propeller repeat-containing protein 2 isoform X3 [Mastomys coucha]
MASVSEPVTFREFCPLYYLLNAIPTKIQRGFRSIVVYLTALDTNGDYIAVGSSIGMLYLYCRHLNQMKKYNFEGKTESITVVKLLSCFDDLVAAGTASGRVAVFQLVSSLPGRNKQLRRFDVTGVHKTSITALAWSPNGMKLFSGDDKGKIVYSSLDLDQGICNSHLVLEEPSSIVQLDYSQKVLLVSTLQRSLLFYTEEKAVKQIGSQPRKSTGKFGACFIPGLCKQSDLTLYAARPGLRLWKADVHGTVQATFILKDVFAGGVPPFELYPRLEPSDGGSCSSPEKHLGLVSCFFREGWVLSWNEYSIYLLDTVNQATVAGLEGLGDIVSVSCTENEIFFLKGDRNIIRISSRPEGLTSIVRDGPEMTRCSEQVRGQHLEKSLGATVCETRLRGSSVASSVASEQRSRSSSLNSTDSGSGLLLPGFQATPELGQSGQPSSQRFSVISSEDFDQELIVKPIKVKKRRRKRKTEGGSKSTCNSSLESTPCSELPADSPQSMTSSVLGSSVDQLSTESPDQESNPSGEVDGITRESNGPEAFHVLEVPGPGPDPVDEENLTRKEASQCDHTQDTDLLSGVLTLPLQPEDDVEAADIISGLEEEPGPAADTAVHSELCLQGQNSSPKEQEADAMEVCDPQSTFSEAPLLNSSMPPSILSWPPGAEQWLPGIGVYEVSTEEASPEADILSQVEVPSHLSANPNTGQKETSTFECDMGNAEVQMTPLASASVASTHAHWLDQPFQDQAVTSSDEEDIYAHGLPSSSSETSVTELRAGHSLQDLSQPGAEDTTLLKADQGLFSGRLNRNPTVLLLVAKSPSRGSGTGSRRPRTLSLSLAESEASHILRPVTGCRDRKPSLSVDRPCARALKVDCPYPLSQITARNSVVWALTEQRALLYREGVSSFCPEGEQWKCDIVSERQALEPVCITLGDQHTLWALDVHGKLWFRTGVIPKKPQGDDDHWWQVSITDYVVFDQCSLFQTIMHATHSVATAAQAPVEKVADKLRMAFWSQQLQCQPSLLGVNKSGVWISSGKNEFHVAKGSLIGTYWNTVVPRGTASATKWAFVLASPAPTQDGSSLWLCQSSKDLCIISAQSTQCRPSTVQLPPDAEMRAYAACQDALWALDSLGQVFIRTLSKSCPTGMHWTRLDLSQLGTVRLTSLACGNQHIWACDSRGGVYFRVGTQPLNPSLMLPAWIMIEPPVQLAGVTLVSVHSSPNDQMLWALDSRWNVHVRTGITEEMPVGTDWEHVPGLQACQLALSTRTVWARCPNGDLARRYGVTDKNPAGDYWKKIPGSVSCFTVTSSDELWAVGPSGCLLQRLTKTFSHSHNIQNSQAATSHPEELEDEWEVI